MNEKHYASSERPHFREEHVDGRTKLFLNGMPLRGVIEYQFEALKGHRGILTVKLCIQHLFGMGCQEPEPARCHNLRIEQDEGGGYVLYLDELRLQRGVMEFAVKAYEMGHGSVAVLVLLVQVQ